VGRPSGGHLVRYFHENHHSSRVGGHLIRYLPEMRGKLLGPVIKVENSLGLL